MNEIKKERDSSPAVENEINQLLQKAGFMTVSEYAICYEHRWKKISFGCKALDDITDGGVNTSGVTELSGEFGTGKTQLCLQLAMMVQLPERYGGVEKDCVFICTEKPFPSERAVEIQESFRATFPELESHQFLDHILVQHVSNHEKLIISITKKIKPLIDERRIGLIIIDSIAGIFRTICDNIAERATQMRTIVDNLIAFANDGPCAIVCVNQMSFNEINNELISVPSLGIAWQRLVTSRFLLTKSQTNETEYERKMRVLFSPYLDNHEANFIITSDGVIDVIK